MKINIFNIKDDLGGNWWHYINASNFGFLSKITNLNGYNVEEDDILIHKEIKEGDRFPTIRYHLIIEDGTKLIKNDEVKEILADKLVEYVRENKRFPFACHLAKIFKNGNAQIDYKPTQFESFALKIIPKMYKIENIEDFFEGLETEKFNPIQSSQKIQTIESELIPVKSWTIESSSDPNKSYTVSRNEDGSWSCTCPHWTYRKTECKHIKKCKSKI